MEEKKLELVTNSPAEMIRLAVSGKANLEDLKGLLALQRDWEQGEAKKAYNKAMAQFKANPPEIEKDKKVGFKTSAGQVGYSHASLYNVTKQISKELSKYGLSASWKTQQNGQILVTCKITHELGHSEETTLSAPSDTTGSKNVIQAIGSTITYLERYTLLALTGLATYDIDDDAIKAVPIEYITDEQLMQLRDLLIAKDLKESQLCKVLKIETLEILPSSLFQKAKLMVEGAKKK